MQRTIKEKIIEATAKLNTEIAERDNEIQQLKRSTSIASSNTVSSAPQTTKTQKDDAPPVDPEEHWAEVIRAKAALEVQIEQMKKELSERVG